MAQPMPQTQMAEPQCARPVLPESKPTQITTIDPGTVVNRYEPVEARSLTDFPDDILLLIANQLSLNNSEDLASLQALAASCHRMSHIVHDKARLQNSFKAENSTALKLLHKYNWNTLQHALLINAFEGKSQQIITDVMHPEIDDPHRWPLDFPLEGWQNIVEFGFLLHAKLIGLGEQAPRDRRSIFIFTPAEMMVLWYSALLWQEVYMLWIYTRQPHRLTGIFVPHQMESLRTVFIMKGPTYL